MDRQEATGAARVGGGVKLILLIFFLGGVAEDYYFEGIGNGWVRQAGGRAD